MADVSIARTGGSLDVSLDGAAVATFVDGSGTEAQNVPKPHVHPLRTPAGVLVTDSGPDDHRWHQGLQFAMPRVNEHNLWGGGTFLDLDRGYEVLDDHGRIDHLEWLESADGAGAAIGERLRWVGHGGEALIDEDRRWRLSTASVDSGSALIIDFRTTLANAAGTDLALETPAQRGRPDGGYGGLFLRPAAGFRLGALSTEHGPVDESGAEGRTLVVHGESADGDAVTIALAFIGDDNPGDQVWLYRAEPFPALCWAVGYHRGLVLPGGGRLDFSHRLVVADGHVDDGAMRALVS